MERRNIQLPPYVDAEIIDTVSLLLFVLDFSCIGSRRWCFSLLFFSLQVYKAVGHNTRNSSSNANKGRAASNNLGSQRDDQDDDYRGRNFPSICFAKSCFVAFRLDKGYIYSTTFLYCFIFSYL